MSAMIDDPVEVARVHYDCAVEAAAAEDNDIEADWWLGVAIENLSTDHNARPHVLAAWHLAQHSEAWNHAMTMAQALLEVDG